MSLNASALAALLAAPALEPPAGVTAQFDNPPNNNGLAMFVTTFCAVMSTLFVLIRLVGKIRLGHGVKAEEVLMLMAYGAYWGTNYAAYALIKTPGYYVHTWDLHNGDLIFPLYLILIYGCCYSAVLPLLKTAILLDWCRIFVPADPRKSLFWWGSMALAGLQCLWGVACILLLNMQCRPHAAIWEFYLESKCYSLPSVMLASASTQVVTDFFMMLLPQHIIWRLNLNWQKRVGVSLVFGVGILGFVSACLRLNKTIIFSQSTDTMYLIGPLLFWADGEMTCAFFIFSITCVPKLLSNSPLSRHVKSILGLSSDGSKSATYGKNSNSYALSRTDGGRSGAAGTKGSVIPGTLAKGGGHGVSKNPYYHLDADVEHQTSESQENLRREYEISGNDSDTQVKPGEDGLVVTRTTHITITSDAQSNNSNTPSLGWK